MSTLAYGALTRKREEAPAGTSKSTAPPALKSYVDTLAALVPAEILALHAATLSFTTTTKKNGAGESITTITSEGTLKAAFIVLPLLSMVLYFAAHTSDRWDNRDWVRMLIPAFAFIAWTMVQKSTAFDAWFPGADDAPRYFGAIVATVLLGTLAARLATNADEQ